ncbi:MAG: alkyl hydroperoxide reductase, partial [Myxococcota bacterium]
GQPTPVGRWLDMAWKRQRFGAAWSMAVRHPVVLDPDQTIWHAYTVKAWPTLVLIDPEGRIAWTRSGEQDLEQLDAHIQVVMDQARGSGTLADIARDFATHAPSCAEPLAFPSHVEPSPDGRRLAISDAGHHRVLTTTTDGSVLRVWGSGHPGHSDGPAAQAQFDQPRGLAWVDGAIVVADAGSHTLRRLDLNTATVSTLAGTGQLGQAPLREGPPQPALAVALRSPWDLCVWGEHLVVTLAGSHQLALFDRRTQQIELWSGTGAEASIDGAVAHKALWAQPSGLSRVQTTLVVVDSEASAVRTIDLRWLEVETQVGGGLFLFGDRDGAYPEARLQHPLGVQALPGGGAIVADTYNGKLKRVFQGQVVTVAQGLHEPSSVRSLGERSWVVADTNAHRIVQVHWGGEVTLIRVR